MGEQAVKTCRKCNKPIIHTDDYMQSVDTAIIVFHKWCYLKMTPAEIMKFTGPFGGYNLKNDSEDS